jgi:dihydroceramidase
MCCSTPCEKLQKFTSTVYLALRYSGSPRHHRMDHMSLSLFLVGLCSLLYHATLRQTVQFSDDLSMLFLAASLTQRLYCHGQTAYKVRLTIVLIYSGTAAMSAIYVRSGNMLLHTYMFAAMLTLIWPRTLYLIRSQTGVTEQNRKRWGRFGLAVGYLVLGFVLWNIDLVYCQQLRDLRVRIGLPWAWLLELHGWWHVLTALGAATYMELIRDLCPFTQLITT